LKYILLQLFLVCQLPSTAQKLEVSLLAGPMANKSERVDFQINSYPSQVGFSSSAFIDLCYWPKTDGNLHYFLGGGYVRFSQVHSFKGHPIFSIDSKIPRPTFHLNGAEFNSGIRVSLVNDKKFRLIIGAGLGIVFINQDPIFEGIEGMFELEDVGSGNVRDIEYFTTNVATHNITFGPVSDIYLGWSLSKNISLGIKIKSFLGLNHLATTGYNYRIRSSFWNLTHNNFSINKGDYIAGLISVKYRIFE
jgi:hypothetical protein